MLESRFSFSSQNVEKRANAIVYEERIQFRTMSKVSKVHIQLQEQSLVNMSIHDVLKIKLSCLDYPIEIET